MEIKDEFDLEFSLLIKEIENYVFAYAYDKSVRIRINNWVKKISQVSNNLEWKKNRNLHAINLLNMLINRRIEEPYNKNPNDGPLQILSKTLVKSRLSKKFWESVSHIYNSILINNDNNEKRTNSKSPTNNKKGKKNNNLKGNAFSCFNSLKGKGIKKYESHYNIHSFYNNKNNINNQKELFNIKRVKTPTMMHRNFSAVDSNKSNKVKKNIFNYNEEPLKIKIENKFEEELKFLRETAIKLEQELNNNEEIIEAQTEENNALKNKIMKLTEILKTLI